MPTVAITGANAGLGYETAKALLSWGYTVLMLCRSAERGAAARQALIEAAGKEHVQLVRVDLASLDSVRQAGQYIRDHFPKLDGLVNNAAVVVSKRRETADGLEMQFGLNHLSHFLLTRELLPSLRASEDGRIVNVSSGSHFRGKMHFDDLQLRHHYQVLRAYAQSKLANVLFTYELHRHLRRAGMEHIAVNAADPGLNRTNIGVKHTTPLHALAWRLRREQGAKPEQGAQTQIHLAANSALRGVSGQYWHKMKPRKSSKASYDEAAAEKLWAISCELCGIRFYCT